MWNCEPCTPVKYGPWVHSCHCFSFFGPVPLCATLSLSPYVYLRPSLFMPLLALYALILSVNQWGSKPHILLFAVRWWQRPPAAVAPNFSVCEPPLPDFFQRHNAALFCGTMFCGTAFVTSSTLRFPAAQPCTARATDVTEAPHTPTVGERQCVLPQPIKSLQDHSGPLEVNSGSSLWWCRHSSLLSQRASLNLTTSPQPGLYCSASLLLNGN